MIRLPCLCGHILKLADDTAGTAVQCPHCGKLRDVPTKDELENITDDGTYRINQTPTADDPTRFAKLRRTYAREKVDEAGQEIDLRGPVPAPPAPAIEELPLKEEEPVSPKYDPETGELIRAMDVRQIAPPDPALHGSLPRPSVRYAGGKLAVADEHPNLLLPLQQLLSPGSVVAMVIVWFTHLFANLLFFVLLVIGVVSSVASLVLAIPFIGVAILAHFSNVIEEIGPERADELPRFLRQCHIIDDIWKPFMNFMLAVAYCFGPALLANHILQLVASPQPLIVGILAGLGAIIFPAALLTTATSGTILNLRPDRLAGTIKALGTRYAFYMLIFAPAVGIYALGIWATLFQAENLAAKAAAPNWILRAGPAYSTLAFGIYSVHFFLWQLGLAYRSDHDKFPWVWQRHETNRSLTMLPPGQAAAVGASEESEDDEQEEEEEKIEKPKIDPAAVRARLTPPLRPSPKRRAAGGSAD